MTQQEVAGLVGVPKSNISKYERGELSLPVDVLIEYARLFHVSTDYICGLTAISTSWNDLKCLYDSYIREISLEQFLGLISTLSGKRKRRLLAILADMVVADQHDPKK